MSVRREDFKLEDVRTAPWEGKEVGYWSDVNVIKNYWWYTVDGKVLKYNSGTYQMNSNRAILDLNNSYNQHMLELFPNLKVEQIPIAYIKARK